VLKFWHVTDPPRVIRSDNVGVHLMSDKVRNACKDHRRNIRIIMIMIVFLLLVSLFLFFLNTFDLESSWVFFFYTIYNAAHRQLTLVMLHCDRSGSIYINILYNIFYNRYLYNLTQPKDLFIYLLILEYYVI